MRKIDLKCCNEDSFKYSVLASLYYYDIIFHLERICKLKTYASKHISTHNTHKDFEVNNPHVSLILYNENDEVIHTSNNDSNNKAYIAKINDYRYVAIKPLTNKCMKLKKILRSFSPKGINDFIIQKIIV